MVLNRAESHRISFTVTSGLSFLNSLIMSSERSCAPTMTVRVPVAGPTDLMGEGVLDPVAPDCWPEQAASEAAETVTARAESAPRLLNRGLKSMLTSLCL